ncbi:CAAX prenyl protease-like protein [Ulvibacter antarcticus]|uniref:CAAX prenyl protease-like protein n=2 Tax=Ulvibacter antarcticus TaxID=442714 RepID=A0A3L9YLD0_9FLAO|nr:CAAX prenyl protease-like protein [Ulvibacter antarcticus]
MRSITYRLAEFFLLFVVMPISFALHYPFVIKAILAVIGFGYIIWVLKKVERISFKVKSGIPWREFWKRILITFSIIILLTSVFVYIRAPEKLFYAPIHHFSFFLLIVLFYSLLSVWPQEIIYRTFFMQRYTSLIKSKSLLIFINAIVFSLAHTFFRNALVTIITFLGGLLFAFSYLKFRSTTLVSIEHAIYGNWLFTVGMGEMLAFPGMDVS